ncbi:MAG: serine/threonine-protein kinase [Pirellula sp.]
MSSDCIDELDDSSHSAKIAEIADEFSDRIANGESVDIEEFAHRVPGAEDVVRDILRSLRFMQEARDTDHHAPKESVHVPVLSGDVGDYEILSEIGRGGMGVVYRARQKSLGRIVALKVLPFASSLDPIKLKRFQVETQSASMIQHPNVVAIYGTGCHQGVHYFAMQYIDGQPLDEYLHAIRHKDKSCTAVNDSSTGFFGRSANVSTDHSRVEVTRVDSRPGAGKETSHQVPRDTSPRIPCEKISFRRIAELVRDCALALHHAHELGVIHRDIKPANLLIDRTGRIWITDFGLAHMDASGNLTATGDVLGTLRYMSPEQATGGHTPVDRRSDIYSLGATMYELLTLEPMLQGSDKGALLRQLTLEEPRAPRKIVRSIPRDLETIVLKATSKEPQHRYGTAEAFAKDLSRFLDDLPVLARRPGPIQILTKLARRHKTASWTLAASPILVAAGLFVSNVEIARQRNRAEEALDIAKNETNKARVVSDMMQQLVGAANPDRTKGSDYTVRQLLDDLSANLFEQLSDQPEVEASLRSTIGNSYTRLGSPEKARPHLLRALELKQSNSTAGQLEIATSLEDLAWNNAALVQYQQALNLIRQAVSIHTEQGVRSRQGVHALWCMQHCLIYLNKFQEADETADRALELAHQINPMPPEVANILHNLSQSKNMQKDYVSAEELARQSVTLHAELHGETHPETGWGLDALARSLQSQKKYREAEDAYRRALVIFRKNYPADHKSVRMTLELLQSVLTESGQVQAAEDIDKTRFAESMRGVLLPTGNQGPALLDLLVERKQYLAAGQLIMSGPELFQSTEQCLKAIQMLRQYDDHIASRFGSERDELARARWVDTTRILMTRAADNCPDNDRDQNSVAWNLVNGAEPSLHMPQQAAELAKKAIEHSDLPGAIWNTLGLAYLRMGENQKAIDAIEESRKFPTSDEYDLVFLAIANCRLGNRDEAVHHLDSAKKLYSNAKKRNPELERFLHEAAGLLKEKSD